MKKLCVLILTLVLTLSAFTACGCTPQDMNGTVAPTRATTPTTPATVAPTIPATQPATETAPSAPVMPLPTEGNNETGVIGSEEPTNHTSNATGPMDSGAARNRRIR